MRCRAGTAANKESASLLGAALSLPCSGRCCLLTGQVFEKGALLLQRRRSRPPGTRTGWRR